MIESSLECMSGLPEEILTAAYHFGPARVDLFLLRAGRVTAHRFPIPKWSLPPLGNIRETRSRGSGGSASLRFPEATQILRPVFAALEGVSLLYIAPHGPLEHMPLHALPVDGRCLVELCPVIYIPCLSMMPPVTLAPVFDEWNALVFGNMTGDLRGAELEALTVAEIHGVRPRIRDQATIASLVTEAPGKNLLHIAGHGYFDPVRPLTSGIPFPDGVLTVKRVAELKLHDALVILSGCVTGLGDERPGEGFTSLVRAFMAAGARGLMVSLWEVDDEMAQLFMVHLHRGIHGRAESLPRVLRESYMLVRDRAASRRVGYDSFYYWAPFKPVGSW
jgi:CHAT domain-containing protein